jgi:hypothetical protein
MEYNVIFSYACILWKDQIILITISISSHIYHLGRWEYLQCSLLLFWPIHYYNYRHSAVQRTWYLILSTQLKPKTVLLTIQFLLLFQVYPQANNNPGDRVNNLMKRKVFTGKGNLRSHRTFSYSPGGEVSGTVKYSEL